LAVLLHAISLQDSCAASAIITSKLAVKVFIYKIQEHSSICSKWPREKHSVMHEELKEKIEALEKAKKEIEIVKKQAAQTHEEYMRLTDKYAALEKTVSTTTNFSSIL
jgi:hypothetical protein